MLFNFFTPFLYLCIFQHSIIISQFYPIVKAFSHSAPDLKGTKTHKFLPFFGNIFAVIRNNNAVTKSKGVDFLKKIIAAAAFFALAAGLVPAFLPAVIESSAPVCRVTSPSVRTFSETVNGTGEFSYEDERDITCALPVVVSRLYVGEGDLVSPGDVVAAVDKKASAAFIESLGRMNMLSFAATDLQAATALIPEKISADCSGRVISTCGSNSAVQSGAPVVTVAQGNELGIVAAISELDIAKVKIGQEVMFTPAAFPNELFLGSVSAISSAARSRYNGAVLETVVDVRISPSTQDKRFKSGLSADVSIVLSEPREIVVLPYSAIEQDEVGEFVYVYENGKALRRDITTGKEFSDGAEIMRGITAKEEIFADPKAVEGKKYVRVEGE
ncbi:MAG TPA: hypothetical protein DEQ68_08810 [Ruminococcaceae bacterium]|nr:hypothetical protein [Oscillospiraceae bacterium]